MASSPLTTSLGGDEVGRAAGLLTLLFTDIVGSTELTARQGDENARAIRDIHDQLVRRQLAAYSGREVQTTGDGFLVTFRSVRNAIACACAIQSAQLEHNHRHPGTALNVRLGLNAGEVSSRDDGLFGSAVNLAARVTAKAGPCQIFVTEVVKHLAGKITDVEFRDRGRCRLKGFPNRWRLYELGWSSTVAATTVAELSTSRCRDQIHHNLACSNFRTPPNTLLALEDQLAAHLGAYAVAARQAFLTELAEALGSSISELRLALRLLAERTASAPDFGGYSGRLLGIVDFTAGAGIPITEMREAIRPSHSRSRVGQSPSHHASSRPRLQRTEPQHESWPTGVSPFGHRKSRRRSPQ